MINRFLFILIFALIINNVNSQNAGFSKTKNGLQYKFLLKNKDSLKVQLGDILIAELTIRTSDSIIYSNKGNPKRIFRIDTSLYKGDLNEGLKMMHKGDIATFIIKAELLKKIMYIPYDLEGKTFYYDIQISDIITKKQLEKELNDEKVKQEELLKKTLKEEKNNLHNYIIINNINASPTSSGLYYIQIKEGKGLKAENKKRVRLNYITKLLSGKIIDTNIEDIAKKTNIFKKDNRYLPLSITIGAGEVIPGLEEGVSMMKVGGKSQLIIPSELGYGQNVMGDNIIPPNSTLIIEVELIDVED